MHFSSPAHVVIAALSLPYFNWVSADEAQRRFISQQLTKLCKTWGLNDTKAQNELNNFFSGLPQSRRKGGAGGERAAVFWVHQTQMMTELSCIWQRALAIPSSEAMCERAFWRHKQQHTDLRNRLDQNSLCALLRIITISESPPQEEVFDQDANARDGTTKRLKFDKDDDGTTREWLRTLVFAAKFAAGQLLIVGDELGVILASDKDGSVSECYAKVAVLGERTQCFYAKVKPTVEDLEGDDEEEKDIAACFLYRKMCRVDFDDDQEGAVIWGDWDAVGRVVWDNCDEWVMWGN